MTLITKCNPVRDFADCGGFGPVRTGVTAIHPRGKDSTDPVFAGWFTLNASGEMTGTTWLEERGLVDGPIAITNTHSVGVVRDAAVAWMVRQGWAYSRLACSGGGRSPTISGSERHQRFSVSLATMPSRRWGRPSPARR